MKQTVGILLDHMDFHRLPTRKSGYEQFTYYNRAAESQGLIPFYISLRHIGKNHAVGYVYSQHKYRMVRRKIPKVIHNRDIAITKSLRKRLARLARKSIVFNRQNRFSKHRIYRLLSSNNLFKPHLPKTYRYSNHRLVSALELHKSLFIKPSSGSVGEGIIKVNKAKDDSYRVQWKKGKPYVFTLPKLQKKLSQLIQNRSYIIQETIPLARYQGRPYDIRVSVQRNDTGAWQVTGMVGKVAAPHLHVTNVAKGGMVKDCRLLFQNSGYQEAEMKRSISRVSLAMAEYLGEHLPHLADIGLDIGVDVQGNIQLIELNGRDQRITFKKAKLTQTFYKTYENPMKYAKYLLRKKG